MTWILLRLSDSGTPITNFSDAHGVLIIPSFSKPTSSPLHTISFFLSAGSAASYKATLFTNIPPDPSTLVSRSIYYPHPLSCSSTRDIVVTVPIFTPGPYSFYIRYCDTHGDAVSTDTFYIQVPPVLQIGSNGINVQLVVSKWIGPILQWDKFFGRVKRKGYNMIHFTPLQQRGCSDSPYSIADQLAFDPKLFQSNEHAITTIKSTLARHQLLSMTDIVWNHTAADSEWIREHPDAGYSADTAPHLRIAIDLDNRLVEFSNLLQQRHLDFAITLPGHVDVIIEALRIFLREAAFWEYLVFERDQTLHQILQLCDVQPLELPHNFNAQSLLDIARYAIRYCSNGLVLQDRFLNRLDPAKLLALVLAMLPQEHTLDQVQQRARLIIDEINLPLYAAYDEDIDAITASVKSRIVFTRLDRNGPHWPGHVTPDKPLFEPYFTRFVDVNGINRALANNGWVWGGNPLVDFALAQSRAYWRREVIVWGDCVKLRYGDSPQLSPHLWARMIEYTKLCASVFDAFRIDNCHLTPLHVGEALLDAARVMNPNLYVVAELFLGLETMDKIFVERLGINSLIREAMQASDTAALSLLVHKHGGRPIGSITWLPLDSLPYPAYRDPIERVSTGKLAPCPGTYSELDIPYVLDAQLPHALFFDCTHDNETPHQKRTVEDLLPNAALVAFSASAIGSVYGYDEMYPRLLDVVGEKRQYSHSSTGNDLGDVKAKLHAIRSSLEQESSDSAHDHEMYIHHEDQYISIQRTNARTGTGWFLIARTKFRQNFEAQAMKPCRLAGTQVTPSFAYTLQKVGDFVGDPEKLSGIPVHVNKIDCPKVVVNNGDSYISTSNTDFPPGSIAVYQTKIHGVSAELDEFVRLGALVESRDLDFIDLNAVLYRCEAEERDASKFGDDTPYSVPGCSPMVYAGLEGWMAMLKPIINNNDLAHPLCENLRQGRWAFEYLVNRLNKFHMSAGLVRFRNWLRERVDATKDVPYFMRPHYFCLLAGVAYEAARFRALAHMLPSIQHATSFVQSLALTSVQVMGRMSSTCLLARDYRVACIAAGLPHFSTSYMRCWGRDVFISFRGHFLVTGRYFEAKQHILAFAQTLKHGLIPNLLDAGRNPRYNARDAVWFFFEAVQQYVKMVPEGHLILGERVNRRFPLDDTWISVDDHRAYSYQSLIVEILFEIFQRHAAGITFREANAGPALDLQMTDQGFAVRIYIDWETGLVHGGLQYNCGTWMDKMGESVKAHNRGVPGTPRDGAAVELQGLLKSALRFVIELGSKFPYNGVIKSDGSEISFQSWHQLIADNFERCFYVPPHVRDDVRYDIDLSIVNRRGMYKDLYRSGKPYEDYQLRPNFAIAMCVAPELFAHGKEAIELADTVLRGRVGMCTLDPSDWNYRPDYHNGVDSSDFATSKGRNYHQGPEWVWCFGYFLRAYYAFALQGCGDEDKVAAVARRLRGNKQWIKELPWAGLTELTNRDGAVCDDSCPTQAWSSSCLLDFYSDAAKNPPL